MKDHNKRIIALVAIRRELKDLTLRVEEEIKSLAGVTPETQVRYQALNTRAWYGIPRERKDAAHHELAAAVDDALKHLMRE